VFLICDNGRRFDAGHSGLKALSDFRPFTRPCGLNFEARGAKSGR
jgi:hypothetical protein